MVEINYSNEIERTSLDSSRDGGKESVENMVYGEGGGGRQGGDEGNEGIKRSLPVFTKHYSSTENRGRSFLRQADVLLLNTISFIRIDWHISAPAVTPAPSAVGDDECVLACM